jgi:cytochrome c
MNGPSLAGVFGRPVGKLPGYGFSADFQKAKGVWDASRMNAYLADPRAMFPSSRMAITVASPTDRAALIAYLRTNPIK